VFYFIFAPTCILGSDGLFSVFRSELSIKKGTWFLTVYAPVSTRNHQSSKNGLTLSMISFVKYTLAREVHRLLMISLQKSLLCCLTRDYQSRSALLIIAQPTSLFFLRERYRQETMSPPKGNHQTRVAGEKGAFLKGLTWMLKLICPKTTRRKESNATI
jgi:hypothetical protein